jgi:hypothetical protein
VLRQLRAFGLLLLQDPHLPSVVTIVAGGPIRGSWLAAPSAHGTYAVLVALEDHPEILETKLVSGKVTFVHRDLWPAVLAVATARSAWQLDGLSPVASWLLHEIDETTSAQTDLLAPPATLPAAAGRRAIPDAARELERRLLVHATEIHTPSGAHAKQLQTWGRWQEEAAFTLALPSEPTAREQLGQVLTSLNQSHAAVGRLPWQPASRRSSG